MISGTLAKAATNQGQLENVLEKLFQGQEILKNSRGEGKLKNPDSNLFLELDIWIPSANICFEFQDEYHYTITWYNHKTLAEIQKKDKQKNELIRKRGDTLISVPYWWDGDDSKLISTIKFIRPDLLEHLKINNEDDECPIHFNPPRPEDGMIPDVGKLMPASFLIASLSSYAISPSNSWWMGEKYDGIRCCWNPREQTLYSRTARALVLPPSYFRLLSSSYCYFDGEIWFGRGSFSESQGLFDVSCLDQTDWSILRLVVFDEASKPNHHEPFEMRYESLIHSVPYSHPLIVVATRTKCESEERIEREIERIINDNGEGIVLRRPHSKYHTARSNDLIKIKATRGDLEGLVTSVNNDATLTLRLPNGITFSAPQSSKIPVKKGDVVTLVYDNFSGKSVPLNPRLVRIRSDLTWEEACESFELQLPASAPAKLAATKKPHKFWISEKGNNMRAFFINFAKNNNFDPFKASSWYHRSIKSFTPYEGFSSVLHHFGGSFIRAIISLFPEINFDKSKFIALPHKYWSDVKNRRKFFDSFAKKNNFDPLIAKNWYDIPYQSVIDIKGGSSLLALYPGKSLSQAIMNIYPEIGLEQSKFSFIPRRYWENKKNRRMFFEDFAKKKKFDPLIAANWYSIPKTHLLVEQGALAVLSFHEGKLSTALNDLFPELNFESSLFPLTPRTHLELARQRRKFISIAKKMGFDPLVPDNWYPVTKKKALSFPGVNHVLVCYRDNLPQALCATFPELKFNLSKFAHSMRWIVPENRKQFFDDFAEEKGFDPLVADNWYNIKMDQFGSESSIKTVLTHYNNSLSKALMQVYPDIGLKEFNFSVLPRNHWADSKNRRAYLDQFARDNNFDPLVAENWYQLTNKELRQIKRAASVLSYSQGSLVKAVMSLYPEIGLQENKFVFLKRDHWPDLANRRAFFDEYATQNGFDPLVPENWYSISLNSLLHHRKVGSLLKFTKGTLSRELVSLYPDIGLEHHKFVNT